MQQILAVEPMENESEQTYRELFKRLKERGLKRIWLCVSDYTRAAGSNRKRVYRFKLAALQGTLH